MGKRHIFVTGASGFLGKYLVQQLVETNEYDITIFVRQQSKIDALKELPLKILYGDITQKEHLTSAMKHLPHSTIIIHCAAILGNASYADYYSVHVDGARNLIEACKEQNIKRVIAISTTSTLAQKRTAYGETKNIADLIFHSATLEVTTLKPDFIYGTGGPGFTNIVGIVKNMPIIPIIGDGSYRKQPIHVTDVVRAILAVLHDDNTIGKTYILAGNDSLPFTTIIGMLRTELNITKPILHIPASLFYLLAFLMKNKKKAPFTKGSLDGLFQDCNFDITPLKKELHINPVSFMEGIKRSL